MNLRTLLIAFVLFVIAVAGILYYTLQFRGSSPEETEASVQYIESETFGFSIPYDDTDEGYVAIEPEDATRGDLVFVRTLFEMEEYVLGTPTEGEGLPGITIEVFRNPMNLSSEEWVRSHSRSNFELTVDGSITDEHAGELHLAHYIWDGLYRADSYALADNGYIYLFTASYIDDSREVRDDLLTMLGSATWNEPSTPSHAIHGDIVVTSPMEGETINSPLTIKGMARGFWFFEATFPVMLTDWDGRIIAEGYASAEGNWMTEEFVPFTGILEFTNPVQTVSDRGTLIIQKANASGLPEHDDAIEITVKYGNENVALIQSCPDEWIQNRMPTVVPEGEEATTPSEYYILDGGRREIAEFDTAWVEANCNLEAQVVY